MLNKASACWHPHLPGDRPSLQLRKFQPRDLPASAGPGAAWGDHTQGPGRGHRSPERGSAGERGLTVKTEFSPVLFPVRPLAPPQALLGARNAAAPSPAPYPFPDSVGAWEVLSGGENE